MDEQLTQLEECVSKQRRLVLKVQDVRNHYVKNRAYFMDFYFSGNGNLLDCNSCRRWMLEVIEVETSYWEDLEAALFEIETGLRRVYVHLEKFHPLWIKTHELLDELMDVAHDLESSASSNLHNLNAYMDLDSFLSEIKTNDGHSMEIVTKMNLLTDAIADFSFVLKTNNNS